MSLQAQREGGYRKGYEPSAPPLAHGSRSYDSPPHGTPTYPRSSPYNDPEFAPYAPAPERRPHHGKEKVETLGDRTMDIVGAVFSGAWKHSRTFLRIDLRRAIRYDGPKLRKRTRRPPITRGGYGQPAGTSVSPGGPLYGGEPPYYGEEEEYDAVGASKSWFGGIHGGGARLKIMQVWDISHGETGETRLPWNINFGFGANVVMDQGKVEPKFRLRANHVALHLLPEPALELRGKWPLGETNLAVYARYRVPISGMGRFWESTNARLMINLYHPFGTGVHLTPGGVQFDEHVIRLGEFSTMRVAAAVDFPKQFPLEEGEQPFRLRLTRLGVKSRIF